MARAVILRLKWLCLICAVLFSAASYALPPLQLYIEITPAGGVLDLPPGRYAGPAIIKRPITINGNNAVEIDGGGDGSVITVQADDVTLRGLRIVNSGGAHNSMDSGVVLEGDGALVEDNVMEGVLFGVHLKAANDNIVRGNTISSLGRDISIRGDGIRMWYSNNNLIENNHFSNIRDLLITNSSDNRLAGNTIENSRVGMEFIFSPRNEVMENTITNDVTGITVIYSNELNIHDNRIGHMLKISGAGISFKESARVMVKNNVIAHSGVGLLANSPLDPENRMTLDGNLFAYNVLGIYFYGEKGGHVIINNRFKNNFTDAMGSAPRTIRYNTWGDNQWDQYQGFDQDGDGVGDRSHDVYLFTEHMWEDTPMMRFFRGSPVMEILDFALRLAPFTRPKLEYSDPSPRMQDSTVLP